MEAIQAPQPVTAGRCDQVPTQNDDGFGLDGTRYNHGFRHCVSRDQPAQTGKHRHSKPKAHTNLNPLRQLTDVARGLKYLHDWPSVHADLKSVGWIL